MSERKPILIPADLYDALAAEAAHDGLTMQEIAGLAAEGYLKAIATRRFFENRARGGSAKNLLEILDRMDDLPPQPGDELPEGYRRKR